MPHALWLLGCLVFIIWTSGCSEGSGPVLSSGGSPSAGGNWGSGSAPGASGGAPGSGGEMPTAGGAAPTGGAMNSGGSPGAGGGLGSGGAADVAPLAFSVLEAYLTSEACSGSDCHGQEEPHYAREGGDLHQLLTTHVVPRCNNKRLVVPGSPEQSALIDVLSAEAPLDACAELPRMPYGCIDTCLREEDILGIAAWIRAGAPKN